jgi:hypothetical protein
MVRRQKRWTTGKGAIGRFSPGGRFGIRIAGVDVGGDCRFQLGDGKGACLGGLSGSTVEQPEPTPAAQRQQVIVHRRASPPPPALSASRGSVVYRGAMTGAAAGIVSLNFVT